jgi:hypothetical protein
MWIGWLLCRGTGARELPGARELHEQAPMLRLRSGPRLDLSVATVATALAACCLVRDVNDPAGLAVPVFFANSHGRGFPRL